MFLVAKYGVRVDTPLPRNPGYARVQFPNTPLTMRENSMVTSVRQDDAFLESVISKTLLEESIDWIISNMSPDDVFSESDLKQWVTNNMSPDDVFSAPELEEWAVDNGYEQTE